MKAASFALLSVTLAVTVSLNAQEPAPPQVEAVAQEPSESLPSLPGSAPVADLTNGTVPSTAAPSVDLPAPSPDPASPTAPGSPEAVTATPAAGAPFGPLEQQKQEMQKSEEGYIIKDAALNDIFQFLAKSAGRQYFHNAKIAGPDYLVTGHLNDGNPLQQMEELAFMYGLSLHTKGNTIYALTQTQLGQLPSAEFHYQLRYLRPTDMEQIKELIKPMLTPGTGIVNFEPKTNTIVIIDSAHRIEQARELLHGIDKAKGQIIVETKILRVNSAAGTRTGINWTSLGDGVSLSVARDLNSVFGLGGESTAANLVLSPATLTGVLKALNDGNIANQVSNPTLITEDNELASISIIDRIPIITATTTPGGAGGIPIITEEVRYKIDTSDKPITEDPNNHREIGISIVVTPTLLPDGTIRMKMRPRSAQITGEVIGQGTGDFSGNRYPRVTESMVESIARVPDGYSLVVGGFYGEVRSNDNTKVPGLGDLPIINFFFKSKEASKETTSLVFVVTPKSYNPGNPSQNQSASNFIRNTTTIDCDHDWVDPYNPGPAHEPNLKRTLRGMQPTEAPYYPRADELPKASYTPSAPNTPKFSRVKR